MPRTPVLTVREDGGFNCDGSGCCGGSSYGGLKANRQTSKIMALAWSVIESPSATL
jgi:hypothetical protein